VSYRSQNQFQSVADLLDVTRQQNQGNQNGGGGRGGGQQSSSGSGQNGQTVITPELFNQIADDVSVRDDEDLPGLINVNTAGLSVLECLPGLTPAMAQAVVAYRQSSGYLQNVATLLQVDGFTKDILKQIAPLICTRSETYRIVCEGKVDSTGATQRVEEIVHVGRRDIETLSYREDL